MTDLFPGFEEHVIAGDGADIYLRKGGSGPALLLLHGFPENHMMWHKVAAKLMAQFTLIIPDMRGYGRSSQPENSADNYTYSKRAMGRDFFAIMMALGYDKFMVCGHDRGARCAYRMALDEPERVTRLAVLDIITTYDMWHTMSHELAMKTYHWSFLAQPYPLPEMMISGCPDFYLENKLAAWNGSENLSMFDPTALKDYLQHFSRPETVHALCNDYRAGETYDLKADTQDRDGGNKIICPLLVLWGDSGIPSDGGSATLAMWRNWANDVQGTQIHSGHFLPEENPDETVQHLLAFFTR